jgi:hypothetical protein
MGGTSVPVKLELRDADSREISGAAAPRRAPPSRKSSATRQGHRTASVSNGIKRTTARPCAIIRYQNLPDTLTRNQGQTGEHHHR